MTSSSAALSIISAPQAPAARPGRARIAGVVIFQDLSSVEPIWRCLESANSVRTAYQSFDFLAAWQHHVGALAGVTPFVVVGYDAAGEPASLWPLGRQKIGPLRVLSFLGGKHANFNVALWRRDLIESITTDNLHAVLTQIALAERADVLSLLRQPQSWDNLRNPFMLLPHQPSPSDSLYLTMTAQDGEEQLNRTLSPTMRGQLRSKERRLQKLAGYRYLRATGPDDIDRLLDAFFPMKAAHMRAQSLPNIFADSQHEAFLRDACQIGAATGHPLIELHALEGAGELLAILATINDGARCSGMFNTYTLSENSKNSPGLILFVKAIAAAADRGMQRFDLGVGEAKYKTFFCKEREPLFDSFLPLTPLGKLAAAAASTAGRVKRRIKKSDVLSGLANKLRQHLSGKQR